MAGRSDLLPSKFIQQKAVELIDPLWPEGDRLVMQFLQTTLLRILQIDGHSGNNSHVPSWARDGRY